MNKPAPTLIGMPAVKPIRRTPALTANACRNLVLKFEAEAERRLKLAREAPERSLEKEANLRSAIAALENACLWNRREVVR